MENTFLILVAKIHPFFRQTIDVCKWNNLSFIPSFVSSLAFEAEMNRVRVWRCVSSAGLWDTESESVVGWVKWGRLRPEEGRGGGIKWAVTSLHPGLSVFTMERMIVIGRLKYVKTSHWIEWSFGNTSLSSTDHISLNGGMEECT